MKAFVIFLIIFIGTLIFEGCNNDLVPPNLSVDSTEHEENTVESSSIPVAISAELVAAFDKELADAEWKTGYDACTSSMEAILTQKKYDKGIFFNPRGPNGSNYNKWYAAPYQRVWEDFFV